MRRRPKKRAHFKVTPPETQYASFHEAHQSLTQDERAEIIEPLSLEAYFNHLKIGSFNPQEQGVHMDNIDENKNQEAQSTEAEVHSPEIDELASLIERLNFNPDGEENKKVEQIACEIEAKKQQSWYQWMVGDMPKIDKPSEASIQEAQIEYLNRLGAKINEIHRQNFNDDKEKFSHKNFSEDTFENLEKLLNSHHPMSQKIQSNENTKRREELESIKKLNLVKPHIKDLEKFKKGHPFNKENPEFFHELTRVQGGKQVPHLTLQLNRERAEEIKKLNNSSNNHAKRWNTKFSSVVSDNLIERKQQTPKSLKTYKANRPGM